MQNYQRQRNRHCGVVLIWVALLMFVLIGFVGLAIDWGFVVWSAQKLQNAADAAAMAGAQRLGEDEEAVRDAAVYFASQNEAGGAAVDLARNDGNGDEEGELVLGVYDREERTFTPTLENPNAVRVLARRTETNHGGVPLFFGPVFGKDTANVSRYAIALSEGGPSGNSIIALDADDPSAFYMHGNPTLDMGSGNIQVNSSNNQAVRMSGNQVNLIGSNVNIVGSPGTNFDGYTPPSSLHFNDDQPVVEDPLAAIPEPNRNGPGVTRYNKISDSGTYDPGYYPGGYDDKPNTDIVLRPGIYIFDNGFKVKGTLTGSEVMIFIRTGPYEHTASRTMKLSPPEADLSGTLIDESVYKGIQIFQSRTNTSASKLVGNGNVMAPTGEAGVGTLYFPAAHFSLGGTNSNYQINSLIGKTIEIFGTGDIYFTRGYESSDDGDRVVYLVE